VAVFDFASVNYAFERLCSQAGGGRISLERLHAPSDQENTNKDDQEGGASADCGNGSIRPRPVIGAVGCIADAGRDQEDSHAFAWKTKNDGTQDRKPAKSPAIGVHKSSFG
jgi:hypothetical protein